MPSILVVEDEPDAANLLAIHLRKAGHEVTVAGDGGKGLTCARTIRPDLILLDQMLPTMSGTEVCRVLKSDPATADIAIIMLTARAAEADRIKGFEHGADDYVTKPFGIGELVARIRVALRHSVRVRSGEQLVVLDDACIDLERRRAHRHGVEVHLTPIEFRLVATLAKHMGLVVAHRQLLREVWGPTHEDDTHYLRIYMKQLREKLEVDPAKPRHFLTELGVGYRLEPKE